MKKKPQKQDVTSLEAFLVKSGTQLKEKREKILQGVLLVLVVILAFILVRNFFYGKPQKFQNELDTAYYLSTMNAFINPAPNAAPYQQLAAQAKGNNGAQVRIAAGEALVKTGLYEISAKRAASEAKTAEADVIAMDPEKTFKNAIRFFEEVTKANMATDALLASRALYDAGAAYEQLAAITSGDEAVADQLKSAQGCYQAIKSQYPNSAFAALAEERLAALARPMTVAFYQKTANAYVTMPEPELKEKQESILSENADSLDPASGADIKDREDFNLTENAEAASEASAEETAPEADANAEAAPTEEANAEAAAPEANADANAEPTEEKAE